MHTHRPSSKLRFLTSTMINYFYSAVNSRRPLSGRKKQQTARHKGCVPDSAAAAARTHRLSSRPFPLLFAANKAYAAQLCCARFRLIRPVGLAVNSKACARLARQAQASLSVACTERLVLILRPATHPPGRMAGIPAPDALAPDKPARFVRPAAASIPARAPVPKH